MAADEKRILKVGSRKSQLAVIQTEFIIGEIKKLFPNYGFQLVTLETLGDKILDKALPKIGEKALFTKELEDALLSGRVDFIVHSLKDLPTQLPSGLGIGGIVRRDNKYDAVILHKKYNGRTLEALPAGSVIGTSSLRRIAQLMRKYPNFKYESVRGNLNTRLRKLDEDNKYDALILAVAGIHRMNWHDRISQILTPPDCLYAVGQGALAVEVRNNDQDILNIISKLNDLPTLICCAAERAYLRSLDGGCSVPVGISAKLEDNKLSLHGSVLSLDGEQCIEGNVTHTIQTMSNIKHSNPVFLSEISSSCIIVAEHLKSVLESSEQCGIELGEILLKKGAVELLKLAREANQNS